MVAWPLKVDPTGRFQTDQNGVPFREQGEASWDAHIALSRTDWLTYLDDRQAKGINTLHFYGANAIAYCIGGPQPWMFSLGNVGVSGASSLPFLLNTSGGNWNGDPTFTNHDAAMDSPSDTFWEQVGVWVDDMKARGMKAKFHIFYAGAKHAVIGDDDGWYLTLTNAHNTQAICLAFGAYLANGHGSFTGFNVSTRPNIEWVLQGDSTPANGSEGALRTLKILSGLQANGATQLVSQHINGNTLPNDQADYSTHYDLYCAYTGPETTYSESRAIYGSASPTRPVDLIETNYWGNGGLSRAQVRFGDWSANLSCIGGAVAGFQPLWAWCTSADGSANGSPTFDCFTTAWIASTHFDLNQYASKAGNWYRCTVSGTTGVTGPSGTGGSISDGGVTWTWAGAVSGTMQGMANLLNEPGPLDHEQLGRFMAIIPWWRLVPSALASTAAIITSGGGTAATWSDGNNPSGGLDWIVSAAAADKSCIVAYIPTANSGTFSVDMTRIGTGAVAFWFDPVNGVRKCISAVVNTGTHSFTTPGANSGGDNDWVLLIATPTLNLTDFGMHA